MVTRAGPDSLISKVFYRAASDTALAGGYTIAHNGEFAFGEDPNDRKIHERILAGEGSSFSEGANVGTAKSPAEKEEEERREEDSKFLRFSMAAAEASYNNALAGIAALNDEIAKDTMEIERQRALHESSTEQYISAYTHSQEIKDGLAKKGLAVVTTEDIEPRQPGQDFDNHVIYKNAHGYYTIGANGAPEYLDAARSAKVEALLKKDSRYRTGDNASVNQDALIMDGDFFKMRAHSGVITTTEQAITRLQEEVQGHLQEKIQKAQIARETLLQEYEKGQITPGELQQKLAAIDEQSKSENLKIIRASTQQYDTMLARSEISQEQYIQIRQQMADDVKELREKIKSEKKLIDEKIESLTHDIGARQRQSELYGGQYDELVKYLHNEKNTSLVTLYDVDEFFVDSGVTNAVIRKDAEGYYYTTDDNNKQRFAEEDVRYIDQYLARHPTAATGEDPRIWTEANEMDNLFRLGSEEERGIIQSQRELSAQKTLAGQRDRQAQEMNEMNEKLKNPDLPADERQSIMDRRAQLDKQLSAQNIQNTDGQGGGARTTATEDTPRTRLMNQVMGKVSDDGHLDKSAFDDVMKDAGPDMQKQIQLGLANMGIRIVSPADKKSSDDDAASAPAPRPLTEMEIHDRLKAKIDAKILDNNTIAQADLNAALDNASPEMRAKIESELDHDGIKVTTPIPGQPGFLQNLDQQPVIEQVAPATTVDLKDVKSMDLDRTKLGEVFKPARDGTGTAPKTALPEPAATPSPEPILKLPSGLSIIGIN